MGWDFGLWGGERSKQSFPTKHDRVSRTHPVHFPLSFPSSSLPLKISRIKEQSELSNPTRAFYPEAEEPCFSKNFQISPSVRGSYLPRLKTNSSSASPSSQLHTNTPFKSHRCPNPSISLPTTSLLPHLFIISIAVLLPFEAHSSLLPQTK